jgi:CRISPR/Cas system-associated protein Csm6
MIFHGFRYVSGKIEHKKRQWQFNRMSPDEQARTLEEEAQLETLQNLVKEEREKNARAELERMRR